MNPLEGKITRSKFVFKSWGSEEWILNDERLNLCSKLLLIKKDKGFSYHFHRDKSEQFLVVSGKVKYFEINPTNREVYSIVLHVGEAIFIHPSTSHSVLALEDSAILETSTFHRDSDSYRTHVNPEISA